MVVHGQASLDDPLQRWLPAGIRAPGSDSTPITLRLLSAHRSGLPRMPANFAPAAPDNPYADYDTTRLYAFINGLSLTRLPGAQYEYSNLGAGLLGSVLARREGVSYEAMVHRRILGPLGMASTVVALTPDARARLALGSSGGVTVSNWDIDALAGAGALRSSAEDMTRFLAAAMGLTRTPLDSAFRLAEAPQFYAGANMRIGLGWHLMQRPDVNIVWHNGGTGGYRTWAGYDRARQIGVVVLSNSLENVDPIGFHALDNTIALPPLPRPVALSAEALEDYIGNYPLTPAFAIAITRQGDRLMAQATNQPAFRLFATARDEFFLRSVNAQISFERDASGRVSALVLRQNGQNQRAPRQ
jgi:CubicO group peptidase (beta-lactamase class C family)